MALLQLQRACERFRSHLSDEETRRVENVKSVEDVREAITQMERYLASRQKLRNFERLVPFLDAADRLTKPIDVLSNGVPFLPYIWAPLKLILQILSAYSRIGASLPRFSRYGNAFPDSHDFQQLLGHIYEDIIDFHCHAYRLVQKPGWAMLFSTCWGRFQHRYDSLLDSIAKTSELIDREAASYEIVQAREWRQKLLEEAQDREKKEEIHQREAVNKWLQPKFVRGSKEAEEIRFCGFMESLVLLIYFLKSNPNWNCLFFFCDFHTTGYGVSVQVLRSICAQILNLVPETASFMHKDFFNDLRLIIDGIDEIVSSEHGELIKTLAKLAETQENFRLLISSQDIPSIARNLKGRPTLIVGKQSASICKDIDLIVSSRLEAINEGLDGRVPESVFTEIRETILKRAEGMFLWVHLVLQVLETTDNIQELISSVEAFPKDLEEAYYKILTSIMSRCQATDVSKLRRIFGWMVFSKGGQPMRKFELRLEDGPSATMVFVHATVPKFLQAKFSGPFINKEDSCRDITSACIAQLTQSLTLADESLERLQHLDCVAQGFYGLLPYAHEHWIEHLLEYLELSQGFSTPDSSSIQGQLDDLSKSWFNLVEVEATRTSSAESFDSRLHWLESLPSARALVQEAFELRKATKESADIVPSSTGRNYPGLLAKNFIAFKEEYGPSAFVCPIYGCDKAVAGYSSILQLKDHSMRHQEKLRCFNQDCFYNDVGFNSSRQLKDHERRCHPSPSPPSIPQQILKRLDQGSQAPATPTTNPNQSRQELQYGAGNQSPMLTTAFQQSPAETLDYKSLETSTPSPAPAPTPAAAQQASQTTQLTETEEGFLPEPQLRNRTTPAKPAHQGLMDDMELTEYHIGYVRAYTDVLFEPRTWKDLWQWLAIHHVTPQIRQELEGIQTSQFSILMRWEQEQLRQRQLQQQTPQLQQDGMPADMATLTQSGMAYNMPSNQDHLIEVTPRGGASFIEPTQRSANLTGINLGGRPGPMNRDSLCNDYYEGSAMERAIEQGNMERVSVSPMPSPLVDIAFGPPPVRAVYKPPTKQQQEGQWF
ncbi:NACHT domain-containing protein [Colletotrichum lupini]|uniref:NACHT domain-containing protein n=1 Tax=Colletotrichum lupini TaxID=145971 RepID=A0A9Q8SB53_9PEZI|nr:NACHT domain-containing protein [Colletotrichum lupini]UQC74164.1 NACHT domain-containing protein [Colletotrichum lupini]